MTALVQRPDLSARTDMAAVARPDLSNRTALSKSILSQFDGCPTQVWFSIHDPRPFVPLEKVTFGSCLDAAIEVIVKYLRMGQGPDMDRAIDAATFIAARDGIAIAMNEVEHACRRFLVDVAPQFDWSFVVTQAHLTGQIEGLGECDGHPDLLFPDAIWDVKATVAKSQKDPRSLELGFYVLLREATEAVTVRRVGYIEWRRGAPNGALKEGRWVTPSMEVTDELRRWALAKSTAFIKAKNADRLWNSRKGAGEPENIAMTGGPAYQSRCGDCVYNPANGGRCQLAYQEVAA